MSIQPIDMLSQPEPSLYTDKKPGDAGKMEFLTLLMAQLQNQDPLNPQDPSDFTAQLAQFSNLEQLINMSSSVDAMTESVMALQLLQVASNNTQAVSLIGKDVLYEGNGVNVQNGQAEDVRFFVPEDMRNVQVTIYELVTTMDTDGKPVTTRRAVRVLGQKNMGTGVHTVGWDGLSDERELVGDGKYEVEITGNNSVGEAVLAVPLVVDRATGVSFENGVTYLEVGGNRVPLNKIYSVFEPSGG